VLGPTAPFLTLDATSTFETHIWRLGSFFFANLIFLLAGLWRRRLSAEFVVFGSKDVHNLSVPQVRLEPGMRNGVFVIYVESFRSDNISDMPGQQSQTY
jgi:hypothetical protein